MRLRLAFILVLLALAVPAPAHAAGLFVSSQRDNTANAGITGLVGLSDGGGESLAVNTGGFRMAGTGVGPIVYGSGVIRQYNGAGGYTTLVSSAGTSIRSMTVTGRGLLVADLDTLKLRSGNGLTPALPPGNTALPGGKLPAGDQWVSITTQPNGLVLGWAFNDGYGELYEINLSTGAVTSQDYSSTPGNNPFFNNRDAGTQYFPAPVFNSGGISADGQGGVWVATAGHAGPGQPSSGNQVYYAAPGTLSFSPVASGYTNPQIAAAGLGEAYVTNTDGSASPFFADVYKVKPNGDETKITSDSGDLTDSRIDSLTVDRCYTSCTISPPDIPGGGNPPAGGGAPPAGGGSPPAGGSAGTGTTSSPLTVTPSSASVTGKGLAFKLRCATACDVSVSGSLVYGKASSSASTKLRTAKVKLRAGKTTTVVLKLSKGQRKAIKKAKKKKRKVTAKVKVVVKPKGGRTATRSLKLKVR